MMPILPTSIEGHRGKQIAPDIWLITDPSFKPNLGKWTALANVGGMLCVVQLRVYIGESVPAEPETGGVTEREQQ